MGLATKIFIFTICLNIASGLFMVLLSHELSNSTPLSDRIQSPLPYNQQDSDVNNTVGGVINMPNVASQNPLFNILNFFTLGIFNKVIDLLNKYVFGFITILVTSGILDASYSLIAKGILSLAYTLEIISLFIGKRLEND